MCESLHYAHDHLVPGTVFAQPQRITDVLQLIFVKRVETNSVPCTMWTMVASQQTLDEVRLVASWTQIESSAKVPEYIRRHLIEAAAWNRPGSGVLVGICLYNICYGIATNRLERCSLR